MASPRRHRTRDLSQEIVTDAPRFSFFQAVRLLALKEGGKQRPALPAGLRFLSKLSLAFPASQIDRITRQAPIPAEESRPETPHPEQHEMTVNFMGLTGPSGVLPVAYTELLLDRRNQYRDGTAHAFLDMFTHRAVSLFYAAWRKYRFYLPFEAGNPDGFSRNVLDIVGLGLRHLQRRMQTAQGGIPDQFLIYYAGLLSQRPVPVTNIAAAVRGFFGVDASIEQFAGQWMHIPEAEQSALRSDAACVLGRSAFVGERIWDRQNKIRLRIGPLDATQFTRFTPGQEACEALRELMRFCCGMTLGCEVSLILKRTEVPLPLLEAKEASPLRLGYTAWLNATVPDRDADDVRFALLK